MTRYYMDISDADDELSRLKRIDSDTVFDLAAKFSELSEETAGITHVRTGSLVVSENSSFETGPGKWEGVWSAGGPSPGMANDPVEYAQAERDRGGDHDFLRIFVAHESRFIRSTVMEFYRD